MLKPKEMRIILGLLICILFFQIINQPCFATATWQLHNTSNGLPGNNVTSVSVFTNMMAVGTDGGVGIWNGESCQWSTLALPEKIASAAIRDLAFDDDGNLWIGTPQGLAHSQSGSIVVYDVADGLPTVDIERIQIKDSEIYVGCYGGFVAKSIIQKVGKSTFRGVNYNPNNFEDALKIRSIGVTGLAMKSASQGWISTKGAGLIQINGAGSFSLDKKEGLASDWVESFWVFEGPSRSEQIIAATTGGLSLIRDSRVVGQSGFPVEGAWITSFILFKIEQEPPRHKLSDSDRQFFEFLDGRCMWFGTKEHGLWRLRDAKWTQYIPENSRLPSRHVNRLYKIGGRLAVCTDAGLVIIPLNSSSYDEFKGKGLGRKNNLTIYPFPDYHKAMVEVNILQRGTDFWVATTKGLSRFLSSSGMFQTILEKGSDISSSMDTAAKTKKDQEEGLEAFGHPLALIGERCWQIFTKDLLIFIDGISWPIYSNIIKHMAVDDSNNLWVVFEKKIFARLRMIDLPKNDDQKDERLEKPVWDYFEQAIPWGQDVELTALWFNDGKLFVGTRTEGFYILNNPSCIDKSPDKYEWEHFGEYEGLKESWVIGFANRVVRERRMLAILHPDGLSLMEGKEFSWVSIESRRKYNCIVGDPAGNLWMGSDGGLIRLTPEMNIRSYTYGNAFLESDRITAVAISPITTTTGVSIWVACDQIVNGSDEPPGVKKNADGTTTIIEPIINGSSVHYFDGLSWDKWKIPGVRCMLSEGDYLWMGTNIRLKRMFVPYSSLSD